MFRLMCAVGGLAAVIVSSNRKKPAFRCGALEVTQLEGFTGAIDTHSLAVPQAKHTLESRFSEPLELLSAAQGTHRQLLVQTGHEANVVCLEQLAGGPQGRVVDTQRRATVTGNITCGLQARGAIAARLLERQAHQGLVGGEEDSSAALRVFVIERNC